MTKKYFRIQYTLECNQPQNYMWEYDHSSNQNSNYTIDCCARNQPTLSPLAVLLHHQTASLIRGSLFADSWLYSKQAVMVFVNLITDVIFFYWHAKALKARWKIIHQTKLALSLWWFIPEFWKWAKMRKINIFLNRHLVRIKAKAKKR